MTSKIVTRNFFDSTAFGFSGRHYDVRWDPEEGTVEIIQAGVLTSPTRGRIKLFSNQDWSTTYTQIADQNVPKKIQVIMFQTNWQHQKVE